MFRTPFARLLLASLLAASLPVVGACSDDPQPQADSGATSDASDAAPDAQDATDVGGDTASETDVSDTSDADVGPDANDANDAGMCGDAGVESNSGGTGGAGTADVPLAGFGAISGECGVLDDELTSSESHYIVNHIDFGADPYDDADESLLTEGGREILADGNAGGSSIHSELFAYEVLQRCELATLLATENEVKYSTTETNLTDLLVEIDALRIGVSVTRAVGWPREDPYTVEQAKELLEDKLLDVQVSSANVCEGFAWQKQILHVLAYADEHAASLETAYGQLDPSVTADTVVIVTVSDGDDAFIY